LRVVDEFLADDRLPAAVYALLTLFIASALVAAASPGSIPEPVRGEVEGALGGIEDIASLPPYLLPLAIFANNFFIAVVVAALSFTVIVPLANLVFNGIVVGYVVSEVAGQLVEQGLALSPASAAALLAPHGSLEIPAVAIAASSMAWITRGLRATLRAAVRNLAVALSLLLVAALAEVAVTPIAFILSQALPYP